MSEPMVVERYWRPELRNCEQRVIDAEKRTEAAEARVAELTTRVGELEAALRDIATGPETVHGKVANGQIDLDQDPSMFRLAAWRWCQEQARAVLAGSPAPVGEALEAEQSWHNVRACPHCGALMPEVEPKAVIEAERAVIKTSMVFWDIRTDSAKFAWEAACDILVEMENGRNYFGKQETERAVVDAAMWEMGHDVEDPKQSLKQACDAYDKAREAEQAKREAE